MDEAKLLPPFQKKKNFLYSKRTNHHLHIARKQTSIHTELQAMKQNKNVASTCPYEHKQSEHSTAASAKQKQKRNEPSYQKKKNVTNQFRKKKRCRLEHRPGQRDRHLNRA
jgi:hypothetical protein